MRNYLFPALWLLGTLLAACDMGAPVATEFKDPTVKLNRVEVQSYFEPPWAGWPAAPAAPTPNPAVVTPTQYIPFPAAIRVPMILAFVWDITNPNDENVSLEQLRFTVEFEAAPSKPGEYFAMNTPIVYEKQAIPAKATNQVRVIAVMDSTVIPGNLAVTSGQRMKDLGLNATKLIQDWWANVGDFKFGIKASAGNAAFKTASGQSKIVPFDGKFGGAK
jgi:hypothetical protein